MAILTGDDAAAPMVEPGMRAAVARRLTELWGAVLILLALGVAAMLVSYDPADPSHFSATGQPAKNWLGEPGAILADPMMRGLGLGAFFLAVFPLAWGLRFVTHLGEERVWARLLFAPLALVLGSALVALHAVPEGWHHATGLGGFVGDSAARALLDLVPLGDLSLVRPMALILGVMTLVAWAGALGVTAAEGAGFLRWLGRSMLDRLGEVTGLAGVLLRRRPADAPAEAIPPAFGGSAEAPAADRRVAPELPPAPAEDKEPGEAKPRRSLLSRLTPKRRTRPESDAPPAAPRRIEPGFGAGAAQPETGETPPAGDAAFFDAIRALADGPGPDPLDRLDLDEPDTVLRDADPDFDDPEDDDVEPRVSPARPSPRLVRRSRAAAREAEPLLPIDGLGAEREYDAPPLSLLECARALRVNPISESALEENARMLETVLEDYSVRGEIVAVKPGPVVTLYELEPAPGLKASRVVGLADDIARSMSALSARVSTVPGRSVIGIELPNATREKVLLREVLESSAYGDSPAPLALVLGKDIEGTPVVVNLAKMPHLLIAGTTGSGKSVAINTMILSLLYRLGPKKCRLIMIDPKMLELSVYDNIPHLLAPVVTDPKKAIVALKWVVAEMEERYRKMSKLGVRNIDGYNARVREALDKGEAFERKVQTGFDDATAEPVFETESFEPEEVPFIVVVVDEMADLMMVAGKEIEACIQRLAQMARASGIHLIMATQRPSVDVITGTIKANFPSRISFQVTSKIDSRTILGEQGAEQLLGQGDMLYMGAGGRIRRIHGPFVSDEEVEEVVQHLRTLGPPDYLGAVTEGADEETQALVDQKLGLGASADGDDELYDRAVAIVAQDRRCSTSYIQRKLAIGYNKAARLVEQMETEGVVSPANGVGKREILIEKR